MADENTTNTEQSIEQNGIPEITFEIDSHSTVTQPTDPTLQNEGQPADAAAVGTEIERIDETISDLGSDISDIQGQLSTDVVLRTDIDTTLAVSGGVADAKATGDAISAAAATAQQAVAAEETAREQAMTALTQDVNEQIQEGLDSIPDEMFPVGSIYMTTLAAVPEALPGTWSEIVLPLTWQNINAGTRGYAAVSAETPARTVRFFLRTA